MSLKFNTTYSYDFSDLSKDGFISTCLCDFKTNDYFIEFLDIIPNENVKVPINQEFVMIYPSDDINIYPNKIKFNNEEIYLLFDHEDIKHVLFYYIFTDNNIIHFKTELDYGYTPTISFYLFNREQKILDESKQITITPPVLNYNQEVVQPNNPSFYPNTSVIINDKLYYYTKVIFNLDGFFLENTTYSFNIPAGMFYIPEVSNTLTNKNQIFTSKTGSSLITYTDNFYAPSIKTLSIIFNKPYKNHNEYKQNQVTIIDPSTGQNKSINNILFYDNTVYLVVELNDDLSIGSKYSMYLPDQLISDASSSNENNFDFTVREIP